MQASPNDCVGDPIWQLQDSPSIASLSLAALDDDDDEFDGTFSLPPASQCVSRRAYVHSLASVRTPLVPRRQRKVPSNLFGKQDLHWERKEDGNVDDGRPSGIAGFFFGFMYEEACPDDHQLLVTSKKLPIWNSLNLALFVAFGLTAAATTVPVALMPTIALGILSQESPQAAVSAFTSRAAASAVMGTACGKFLNGPAGDIFGARRVSCIYALLLTCSLLGLAFCQSDTGVIWACFFVEFCQSVQWPCVVVILATHYGGQGQGMYEGGIYVTSLASRFGSLIAIPLSSLLLRSTQWRTVAQCGALVSFTGAVVAFLFVSDSPMKAHDPQNPIRASALQEFAVNSRGYSSTSVLRLTMAVTRLVGSVFVTNLVPSLRTLLKSGTFWIVAIAHTGGSMVRTSERILGTYFHDTSFGTLTENRAGGLVVFLSLGTIVGLAIGGSMFTKRNAQRRKRMVSRLYMMTIGACYMLAFLAIPRVRVILGGPGMVLVFQVMSAFVMGFGVAVQCYHIPGLVGATFGRNKGLYAAYTDGVAYGLSSIVWRIVGDAVQEGGNPQGGGWAYGWAAVALLVILCAVLMVEFMEHYFARASKSTPRQSGGYETIIFV